MAKVSYYDRKHLFKRVKKEILRVNTIMDVGCGIMPQKLMKPKTHICCEPYAEYVRELKKKTDEIKDREWIILQIFGDEIGKIFPENSVDSIFMIDVIEHLEKDVGRDILEKCLKIAKHQMILFTPIGFFPQHHTNGKDAWGLSGADFQEHKSGWDFEDFSDDWKIFACKNFHQRDNLGNEMEKPFGAMFCIYTKENFFRCSYHTRRFLFNINKIVQQTKEYFLKVSNKLKK